MNATEESALRTTLVNMLTCENAHADIETVLSGIPLSKAGILLNELPYTIWQLMEHIRITQWDIVEFCKDLNHRSPHWPDKYWPDHRAPNGREEYDHSLQLILRDRERMAEFVHDPKNDLLKPFPHGTGQNLLHEVILIVDHNSHHLGEIIVLKRLLGIWK